MVVNLVTVGNSSIDNIITPSRTFYPHVCGGNCFHSGIAASILNENVALLTCVPSNFPSKYLELFGEAGVETSSIKVVDVEVNYEELFIYEENGDRIDNLFLDKDFEFRTTNLTDEDVAFIKTNVIENQYTYSNFRSEFAVDSESLDASWDVKSVHLAPTNFESHYSFLKKGFSLITLDPGAYLKKLKYDEVIDILNMVSVFMPSKKELSWIYPDLELYEAMKKLIRDCGVSVVCKNGQDGSLVYDAETKDLYKVGIFPTHRNDLTGAGDSFCGSFNAAYYSESNSLINSVRIATVVAGKAIETVSAEKRKVISKKFALENYSAVPYIKI